MKRAQWTVVVAAFLIGILVGRFTISTDRYSRWLESRVAASRIAMDDLLDELEASRAEAENTRAMLRTAINKQSGD